VIDHVSLQVGDVAASAAFYGVLLTPLGLSAAYVDGTAVGFADGERAPFWLTPSEGPETRELHLAFGARDRTAVIAFHRAAQELGAEVLHDPRTFPEYGADYFACFVRDPDGHNVEAVCRQPDGQMRG
jgi:catechol 2,3-dioxygenase-like lactoylglutathione lyase family enzyme